MLNILILILPNLSILRVNNPFTRSINALKRETIFSDKKSNFYQLLAVVYFLYGLFAIIFEQAVANKGLFDGCMVLSVEFTDWHGNIAILRLASSGVTAVKLDIHGANLSFDVPELILFLFDVNSQV